MAATIGELLGVVKSAPIQEVQGCLIDMASKWMAAGCVEQANHILSVVRETGDLLAFAKPLAAFEIPWSLTGLRPTPWPASMQDTHKIELDLWNILFGPHNWSDVAVDHARNANPDVLEGKRLLIRAVITAYDETHFEHVAAPERLAESAVLLDRLLGSGSPDIVGNSLFQALTCRAILAARLGDIEQAKKTLVLWGEGYKAHPTNWIVWYPLMDRAVATILLSDILAPVWQITPQQCEKEAGAIERAVRERLRAGRQLAYGNLGWTQLLDQLGEVALKGDPAMHVAGAQRAQNLEREPATPAAIKATEARLGRSLPGTYRGFLEASNGFGMYSSTGVEILPVEDIRWLRDANVDLINSYDRVDERADLINKLRESLLIGRDPNDEQQLLLVPADKASAEMECWFFASWLPGQERHPNFRYFIESEARRLRTQ